MKIRFCKFITAIIMTIFMVACSEQPNQPKPNNTFNVTQPFTTAYAFYYGNFYQDMGISTPVFALDFYTEQLTIDSLGNYQGTGYNLTITDIFVPTNDSTITQGTYTIDSINYGEAFTIIPGKQIGTFTVGALLTQVSNDFILQHYLTTGTLQINWSNDTAQVHLQMFTDKQDQINTHFQGPIPTYFIEMSSKENPTNNRNLKKKRYQKYVL